jgi:hypothetical protein
VTAVTLVRYASKEKPFAVTGRRRMRVPHAAQIAFVTARATAGYGISPISVGGWLREQRGG